MQANSTPYHVIFQFIYIKSTQKKKYITNITSNVWWKKTTRFGVTWNKISKMYFYTRTFVC